MITVIYCRFCLGCYLMHAVGVGWVESVCAIHIHTQWGLMGSVVKESDREPASREEDSL